jgi:hypothetical protein
MSQMGQTRTGRPLNPTSVVPLKADLADQVGHVGFVPSTDMLNYHIRTTYKHKQRRDTAAGLLLSRFVTIHFPRSID